MSEYVAQGMHGVLIAIRGGKLKNGEVHGYSISK
jgi:hypothetical protein